MSKTLTMRLPLFIELPRKTKKAKRISLNLNTYRNLHYILSNQAKDAFKEYVKKELPKDCPKFYRPTIIYHFMKSGNRRTDLMNWIAVIDKFFLDALVELGYLPDDNTDHVWNYGIDYIGQTKQGYVWVVINEED